VRRNEENPPSVTAALNQIACYDLKHMDIPNAEEVFTSAACAPSLRDRKTNDTKPSGREGR
jgi:hypothetical protein